MMTQNHLHVGCHLRLVMIFMQHSKPSELELLLIFFSNELAFLCDLPTSGFPVMFLTK